MGWIKTKNHLTLLSLQISISFFFVLAKHAKPKNQKSFVQFWTAELSTCMQNMQKQRINKVLCSLNCSAQCPEGGGYCKFTTIAKRLGFYTDSWSLYRIYTLPVPLACI